MQIWPAIDILDGQCVRLIQGDYDQITKYGNSPADMASRWVADGAECLHLVDLDGARDGSNANYSAVADIVSTVGVPCQLGGGIRDESTIVDYLELGLHRLIIGTKAFKDPDWFDQMCQKYPNRLVVGLDARDGRVATDGWKNTSDHQATQVAQRLSDKPIAGIIYTDIDRDGMLKGPNFDAVSKLAESTQVPVTASGGITTVEDVRKLSTLKVDGCIIGKSLYEGKLTLLDAKEAALHAAGSDAQG